jgi:hypothetical protein
VDGEVGRLTVEWVGEGASGRERLAVGEGPQVPKRVFLTFTALALGSLMVAPWLLLGALFGSWDLYGQAPTDAESAAAQRHAIAATVVGGGCAGLGWLLAVRWRRRLAQLLFGTIAVVAFLGGLLVHEAVTPDLPGTPVRDRGPTVCQEHSGGDNRCPGG